MPNSQKTLHEEFLPTKYYHRAKKLGWTRSEFFNNGRDKYDFVSARMVPGGWMRYYTRDWDHT